MLFADARHWETATALLRALPTASSQLVWMDDGASPDGSADLGRAWRRTTRSRPPADLDADCVAGITYTGGTTGLPKGVMQTHGNLMVNAKHMLWANPLFESRPLPAPHPDVPLGGRRQHVRPDARRPARTITCPGFDPDLVGRMIEQLPRLGLRARADDDQHVPQPSRYGRARPVDVAAVPLRRLADPDGAPPAGDGGAAVRLLAGLRHDRDVAALLPAHERATTTRRSPATPTPCGGSPAPARRASASTSRSAAPTARRATSARWARSRCADRT